MIAEQATLLGAKTVCLDPAADAPAFRVCDEHIVAPFDDVAALEQLCKRSDAVTYEFENIPGEVLIPLERKYNIPQGFRPLFDSQDRVREKLNARENGLRVPAFAEVDGRESLLKGIFDIGYPCVFKTRTLGYDGHGQVLIREPEDIKKTAPYMGIPSILEEFIPFDYEASIVMVSDGEEIISFPVGRNIHSGGILDLCIVPAPQMSETVRERIEQGSRLFMKNCGYAGILAIEYFVRGENVYFNEMAPRPHNSGHYTIEGCTTNQFRELCRFLLGEKLQQPELIAPTVMKNILGKDLEAARRIEGEKPENVFTHLYGKTQVKPLRKMGHITFLNTNTDTYNRIWKHRFAQ